jgi:hypothetical protein
MSSGCLLNVARSILRHVLLVPALLLSALLASLAATPQAPFSFSGSYPLLDEEVIRYNSTPPEDLVARLQRRLDAGKARLSFEGPQGYLRSVLRQLKVPLSSQMLVFSKTSFQQDRISPATPRALYFNDSVYVGWVPGGEVVELAAVDPNQGTMFYTLDQRSQAQPKFVRRQECLQCHASPKTVGVPGLLMRSVFTAPDGSPELHARSFVTDDSSPLKERWGGWYVTGTHGSQRHMGNVTFADKEHPDRLDMESGANVNSLQGRFDVAAYAAPHSDLVALMILAHQARLHNLISRVNWETRIALSQQASRNKAMGVPEDTQSDSTRNHIAGAVEVLLRAMLFTDEARLEAPVRGTSRFAREFSAAGPKDHAGRSLRDLDLSHRMFRYPCSFLIYSEAFDALPKPALDVFYRRLWNVLTGKETDTAFATLSRSDREAVLSILRQTKLNLPGYWGGIPPRSLEKSGKPIARRVAPGPRILERGVAYGCRTTATLRAFCCGGSELPGLSRRFRGAGHRDGRLRGVSAVSMVACTQPALSRVSPSGGVVAYEGRGERRHETAVRAAGRHVPRRRRSTLESRWSCQAQCTRLQALFADPQSLSRDPFYRC